MVNPSLVVESQGPMSKPNKISLLGRVEPITLVQMTQFGKIFSPFSLLTVLVILSLPQPLPLHLPRSACLKLTKQSINKLKLISTSDKGVGTSDDMKRTQAMCRHRAIHPLHDRSRCNHVTPICLLLKSLSVCFTFVKVLVGMLYVL